MAQAGARARASSACMGLSVKVVAGGGAPGGPAGAAGASMSTR